jgi:hypothetical protein
MSSLQAFEIYEQEYGVTLRPSSDADKISSKVFKMKSTESKESTREKYMQWYIVPILPTYVPFGQLHLLEKSLVEPLSSSKYAK